jgi:hypothetical protein
VVTTAFPSTFAMGSVMTVAFSAARAGLYVLDRIGRLQPKR